MEDSKPSISSQAQSSPLATLKPLSITGELHVQPASGFPFLALPCELRQHVYNFLFSGIVVHYIIDKSNYRSYRMRFRMTNSSPPDIDARTEPHTPTFTSYDVTSRYSDGRAGVYTCGTSRYFVPQNQHWCPGFQRAHEVGHDSILARDLIGGISLVCKSIYEETRVLRFHDVTWSTCEIHAFPALEHHLETIIPRFGFSQNNMLSNIRHLSLTHTIECDLTDIKSMHPYKALNGYDFKDATGRDGNKINDPLVPTCFEIWRSFWTRLSIPYSRDKNNAITATEYNYRDWSSDTTVTRTVYPLRLKTLQIYLTVWSRYADGELSFDNCEWLNLMRGVRVYSDCDSNGNCAENVSLPCARLCDIKPDEASKDGQTTAVRGQTRRSVQCQIRWRDWEERYHRLKPAKRLYSIEHALEAEWTSGDPVVGR